MVIRVAPPELCSDSDIPSPAFTPSLSGFMPRWSRPKGRNERKSA